MANLTPAQKRLQDRFEALIAAAAPFLDAVLAVGDRISRIAEPEDHEHYPIRSGEALQLPGEKDPEAYGVEPELEPEPGAGGDPVP